MKNCKRILSITLILVMILSCLPVLPTMAQDAQSGMTFTQDKQYQLEKGLSAMPRTLEAWVKFDAGFTARGGCIIGNYDSGRPNFVLEINTNGNPRLYMQIVDETGTNRNIDVKFNSVNVCTGAYVHLAVVINDVEGGVGTVDCYVNGELKQTKAPQYAIPKGMTVSAPLIGGDLREGQKNTQYFKGELKGVALYEDVRTAAEVKADMTTLSPEGLVAAWDLTGQQGAQTLKDMSGNGYDASLPMTFTQTDIYQAANGLPSMPRTIETWVKFDATYAARSGSVIGNYNSGRPNLAVEFNASGKPRLFMQDETGKADISLVFSNAPSVYTGKWVHVAFAIDDAAGKVHCYIDGMLKQSMDAVIPTAISTSGMVLGGDLRSGNTQWFKGQLRSVAVYTDMRSGEEIAADMAVPGNDDLMAYWVAAGNLGKNAIYDESGNGYHAVLKTPVTETNAGGLSFSGEATYKTEKQLNVMPHTIEAEIYLPADLADDQRGGVIVGNYGAGDVCINLEVFTEGIPRFYLEYEGDKKLDCRFKNVDLRTGTWTHVAIVVNDAAGTVDCYVNGYLAESIEQVVEDAICNNAIALGGDLRSGNERYFQGGIKSVAFFADARTASEVKADMASMTGVRKDDLLAAWNMEGENAPQQIADNSGNGYTVKRYTTWFSEKEPVTDYSYSMVVVGDTQKVTYKDVTNGTTNLTMLYDWILNNLESKNIQYVMGMGDITDKNLAEEWSYVYDLITQMDGKVGYSLVRGNHDGSALMNETFNKGNYADSIEGSFDGSIENTWRTLTVGAVQYLIMTLDYGASDAVLQWANRVVEEHPDHNVIITTHAYMFRDGTTLDRGDVCPPSTSGGCNDGDHLWEKLVSKHSNIVLVLSGHDPCDRVVMSQDTGDHGNVVTQILVDPQGVDAAQGSTGMITVLYFSEDGKNVQVETYSTIKEQYFMTENQFSFTLDVVEDTDDKTPAEKPAVPAVVDFSSVAEAWESFRLYSTSSGGFTVRDGKLVPGGLGGEFKAIYNGNGSPVSSVSVDIYPNGENGMINGGLYIGASDAANGQDQINALYVGIESNMTGWDDAPNRVDLVIGQFPEWVTLSRVISETGKGNNLFTGGVKEPLTLRVDINGNTVTATVSLKSDPTKSISATYTADQDLSQGQVGIRSQHNNAAYDNFFVNASVNAPAALETFDNTEDFTLYTTSEGGFAAQDGKLVPTGDAGEFKAIYNESGKIIDSVSVELHPVGDDGPIYGGLYVGAANAANEQDSIDALYIGVESHFTGWEDAANRVDLVIGQFPAWKEYTRVTAETGNQNNLFTGGVKEPLVLRVEIVGNTVIATVSLKSDPSKCISAAYTADYDLTTMQVGIRSHHNNAMYDNFAVNTVAAVGGQGYGTLAEAVSNAENAVVTVMTNSSEVFTVTGNTTIDLAGHTLTGVIAASGSSLKIVDCAATYETPKGFATVDGQVEMLATADRSYLTIGVDGIYQAHPYSAKLTHVSLDADNDALGYKAKLYGDEQVQSLMTGFGFRLWVNENNAKSYMTTGKQEVTLRLKGILANNGGEMNINAVAVVTFAIGETTYTNEGTAYSTTMKATLQRIDGAWDAYSEAQQKAVLALCEQYRNVVEKWELNHILVENDNG